MKTIIFLAIMFWASSAIAKDYYLTCDPQVGVASYTLIVNGVEDPTVYLAEPDGSAKILVSGFTSGPYVFALIAVHSSGWGSDTSDPLDAEKPAKSLNARIVGE